jgi:trk system potassium uptake protein TrkH
VRIHDLSPSTLLVSGFAAAILVGALLLVSPLSRGDGAVTFIDALFTSTSAVCVTGLTVVDTGTRFSYFGQGVIVLLCQAGGLGVMTFAVFFTLLMGRSFSFQDRMILQDSLHHSPTKELRKLVWYIFGMTAFIETMGAVVLYLRWRDQWGGRAVWLAVFHSISAFCNAGFGLFRDNLMSYRGDVVVNLVVTGLIIVGGLGFIVNMELWDRLAFFVRRRRQPRMTLHTRVVVVTTVALLIVGSVGFWLLERENLLRGLSVGDQALAAWFASVTPRTAGFNTVDMGRATANALLLTMFLMFVGGSPGSTAGGIKTTSLALIVALFRARWQSRGRAFIFKRTIPHDVMDRALTLTILAVGVLAVACIVLVGFDQGSSPFSEARHPTLALAFEAFSAFGTVGLSTGLTAELGSGGKLVLIFLMFAGRVGPLTLVIAVGRRREKGRFRYAEENIMVG